MLFPRNITIDQSQCYPKCEGLLVSSFLKNDFTITDNLKMLAKVYQEYKGYFLFSETGNTKNYESNLRMIRIRDINRTCIS